MNAGIGGPIGSKPQTAKSGVRQSAFAVTSADDNSRYKMPAGNYSEANDYQQAAATQGRVNSDAHISLLNNRIKVNPQRTTKIRLDSGTGPSSNMFLVKDGKLMMNKK